MDSDFNNPKFDPGSLIKSYSKHDNSLKTAENRAVIQSNKEDSESHQNEEIPRAKVEELTTKNAVAFLLAGTLHSKVCRYCLCVTTELYNLEKEMKIGHTKGIYSVTLKDMIASFHPYKVAEDPNLPNKICNKCIDRTLSAYLFTQQCDHAERAIINCLDDVQTKLQKLDPIEGKKRGRRPLNPNCNKIYIEHANVFDYAEPVFQMVNTSSEILSSIPGQNPLECLRCFQVLPDALSLANHSQKHPKTMWFSCRLCGQSFPKLYLLRRHNLREHLYPKQEDVKKAEEVFECKTCGERNEKYYRHIQHIEKHKFKTVMEHLVNSKMDKLCSVCLDKPESSLVPLNKTVMIHGGPPNLMGERTMQSILSSSMPEKSYKYRELHVANYAKITFLPRKKINKRKRYNFQNPIILDTQNFKYLKRVFDFSEPKYVNLGNIDDSDNRSVKEINVEINNESNSEKDISIVNEENVIFHFSAPNLDVMKTDNTVPRKSTDELNSDLHKSIVTHRIKGRKRIGCENEMLSAKQTKYDREITEDFLHVDDKKYDKTHDGTNLVTPEICKNISKVLDVNEIKAVEDIKWQCNTCMTQNIGRETCFCCEAMNPLRYMKCVKFNFKHGMSSYALKDVVIAEKEDDVIKKDAEKIIEVPLDNRSSVDNTNTDTDIHLGLNKIETNNNMPMIDVFYPCNNKNQNAVEMEIDEMGTFETNKVDFQIESSQNVPSISMETCMIDQVDDFQMVTNLVPAMAASMDTLLPNKTPFAKSFEFSIGSTQSKNRGKNKKRPRY